MDAHRRSVVKGATWRLLATVDTVLLSLIFTGSFTVALSIGGLELITKVFWYYAHERLWLRIPGEHDRFPSVEKWLGHDKQTRSVIKAFSWRFFGALDTFFISLIITGHVGVSGAIGGTELITKVFLYYLHDRAWLHVRWGKHQVHAPVAGPVSRFKELTEVFRRHYHISVAVAYGVACVLFVAISAFVIYGLHSVATAVPSDAVIRIGGQ